MKSIELEHAPLGKKTEFITHYQPDLLFPISRAAKREELGITDSLPFLGEDIWNAYELSWLNSQGKPVVAAAELRLSCVSPMIVESKSMKLYLNSFNNTQFDSFATVQKIMTRDLTKAAGHAFHVKLIPYTETSEKIVRRLQGIHLDELEVSCDTYETHPEYLTTDNVTVTETLCSDLLRSNCLVTKQPDWGSIQIHYSGKQINHAGLLKYIISFRNHIEFHEQCVERIFIDLINRCHPEKLFVYARYTRRGGIDINPYRANYKVQVDNSRLWRQ